MTFTVAARNGTSKTETKANGGVIKPSLCTRGARTRALPLTSYMKIDSRGESCVSEEVEAFAVQCGHKGLY